MRHLPLFVEFVMIYYYYFFYKIFGRVASYIITLKYGSNRWSLFFLFSFSLFFGIRERYPKRGSTTKSCINTINKKVSFSTENMLCQDQLIPVMA